MVRRRWKVRFVLPAALSFAFGVCSALAAEVQMVFYGNQAFKFISPQGKVVWVNPWIKGNPDSPLRLEDIDKADLILAADGHPDDMGDAVEIGKRTGATVIAPGELALWMRLQGLRPEKVPFPMGVGGRRTIDGITILLVNSLHGSGISVGPDQPRIYGGPAVGFIITFENGLKVYHAASSALTLDFQLYGSRYKPHVALLHVGGLGSMHPDDAAYAAKLLMTDNPNLQTVVPQHHRIKEQRPGAGTPEEFEAEVKKLWLPLKVLNPKIGQVYTLTR
jgi:L-ascorbate metabolism protein UlaG (beta-lactamase superfamily)